MVKSLRNVFGHQKVIGNTAGLLKAVLDLDIAEYRSMRIVDPHLRRGWRKDKSGIVDIRINTASGKVLHVEVQVASDSDIIPRILYYQGKLVTEQVGAGERYQEIHRTISIIILNYTLLKDEPADRYKNIYCFLNTGSHRPFTDLQEIVILELPKVPEQDDGTPLWPWLRFFKCKTMKELEMLAKKHPELAGTVRQFRRFSPIRTIQWMIFEYEDARRIRMGQDAYIREEAYKEAETKYRELLAAKEEELTVKLTAKDEELTTKLTAKDELLRQLREEIRRLRGQ
ncbi:MAG: Rpn family recombination-promoting nuclease/putative transposase [Treponema sp.]|jgi:predicted transposase/invertase (TIGR01784 family)|nr:Rpn family recombination-promoting nuclease/putative transposase [Treponema sp.]